MRDGVEEFEEGSDGESIVEEGGEEGCTRCSKGLATGEVAVDRLELERVHRKKIRPRRRVQGLKVER